MSEQRSLDEVLTQGRYALIEKAYEHSNRLDRIVSQLPNVVFETDSDGNWTFLNQAWEELIGHTVEASLGTCFLDYVFEADRQRNMELFQPLIERKKSLCRHQIRYLHKDGYPVWVEVQASLLLDANDQITGTAGTLTNVHRQRLMNDQLLQKDRMLEATYTGSRQLAEGPLDYPQEERLIASIAEAAGLIGAAVSDVCMESAGLRLLNAREMVGESAGAEFRALSHDQVVDAYPALGCIVASCLTDVREACTCGWSRPGRDGAEFNLLLSVRTESGLRKVILLISPSEWNQHDINALKLLAQQYSLTLERHDAMQRLRESEHRLNFALEASNEGVWDWNVVTGEVYFSPRWLQMMGYEAHEIAPHVDSWSNLLHPDDHEMVMRQLQHHLDGDSGIYQTTHKMRHHSGKWIWALDRGKVVERDADGRPLRAVGTLLDVTEKVAVEARLAKRTADLAKANMELDAILMISPVGFLAFDHAGRSSFYTPCFGQLLNVDNAILGLTAEEVRHQLLAGNRIIVRVGDDDSGFVIENDAQQIIKLEFSRTHPLESDSSMLISATDITREYNLDKMKAYFISAASHELRTPLSSICGFSELLVEGGDLYSE